MHRALYRTYRPQTFDDVCGQKQITDILKYQVLENKASHAYLFCGSRGTGKTTCAKILSKAVNCLHPVNGNPCNCCEACKSIDAGNATDVIEMDAASNNGVDNVRDLKEEIIFMPAELKYKVYIIDEVHMMSPSAFNALLKTLEEPPSYVIFILATTEFAKLPATIVSRCQRCDFRRISTDAIMDRLFYIAKNENITLEDSGARIIARAAQGGMRDAVSLLELCASSQSKIDDALVATLLGTAGKMTSYQILRQIATKDLDGLYTKIQEISYASGDLALFLSGVGDALRDLLIFKTSTKGKEYLDLTDAEWEELSQIAKDMTLEQVFACSKIVENTLPVLQKTGVSRRTSLELAITQMCDPRTSLDTASLIQRIDALEKKVKELSLGIRVEGETPKPILPEVEKQKAQKKESTKQVVEEKKELKLEEEKPKEIKVLSNSTWKGILSEFFAINPQFSMIFRFSTAREENGALVITTKPHFLLSLIETDDTAKEMLLNIAEKATGNHYQQIKIETSSNVQDIDTAPSDETNF